MPSNGEHYLLWKLKIYGNIYKAKKAVSTKKNTFTKNENPFELTRYIGVFAWDYNFAIFLPVVRFFSDHLTFSRI